MTGLEIVLDLTDVGIRHVDITKPVVESRIRVVGAIPNGMESGKPSVAMICSLPDGTQVFAETSMALFMAAAKALGERYGFR